MQKKKTDGRIQVTGGGVWERQGVEESVEVGGWGGFRGGGGSPWLRLQESRK